MNLLLNKESASRNISDILHKLFPIHRTLVNEGYLESLEIIQTTIPLEICEFPSGKQVYDWVIPNSWNVKEAYITNSKGEKLVDFKDHNLHLSAYSRPFKGNISYEELLKHVNFREDLPNAIPYNFHYYKSAWSFNLSYEHFREKFTDTSYNVVIDVHEYPDNLRVGEYYLPGKSKDEILITSYLCHPSMVNDNLSGVVVVTELFKYLERLQNRNYSYRLIIIPETIGAIAYIANREEQLKNVKAGFTVHCCGDSGKFHYKKSYSGTNYTDVVFDYALNYFYKLQDFGMLEFWPGGSDERQFNGAGIRLPMGAVTRSPAAEFKEYHTSLDNLDLIKTSDLVDTLDKLWLVINVLEADVLFRNLYKGEPCFSRHNIQYPSFKDALAKSAAYNVKILSNEIDGTNSLLSIAKKWNLNIFHLYEIALSLEKEQLIIRI